MRRRGHALEFAHFSELVEPTAGVLTFQGIQEFRKVAHAGKHLIRGWFGGEISAGTGDGNYVHIKVELRAANGTPIYTTPESAMRLTTVAPGHLKGTYFAMKLPLLEVAAAEDYSFAVIADGTNAGSIEFPIILEDQ